MKIFLYYRATGTMRPLNLDYETCLGLAAHAPTTLLTKDIAAWRDTAKHDSRLEINPALMLIALVL